MTGFGQLMGQATAGGHRFGHREHVFLTWLAIRRYGTERAIDVVSDGIQTTARYAGVPQKYNATVSRAWTELVAYHVWERPGLVDFRRFLDVNPALLDKRLLTRFYRPATLAAARSDWAPPDRAPFPWQAVSPP
jgi:hypothetical protein